MTHQEPSPFDPNEEALDRLLHQARWPSPQPGAMERLEYHVIATSATTHQRRRWAWRAGLGSMAAMLLLGTGMWLGWQWRGSLTETQMAEAPSHDAIAVQPKTPTPNGSPATARLALPPKPDSIDASIQWAIQAMVDRPQDEAILVAKEAFEDLVPRAVEQKLILASKYAKQPSHRLAALSLLGEVATDRAMPTMLRAAQDPVSRSRVLKGLARVGNAETMRALARTETNPNYLSRWLSAMLSKSPKKHFNVFLDYVANDATREPALNALTHLTQDTKDQWFDALAAQSARRHAAAIEVLARVSKPEDLVRYEHIVDVRHKNLNQILKTDTSISRELQLKLYENHRFWSKQLDLIRKHQAKST